MASGDVVNDVQSIAAGANLDFQPAADVEVVIKSVGSSLFGTGGPDLDVGLFDGTLFSMMYDTSSHASSLDMNQIKMFINNTNRLRLVNTNASTANLSFSGVEL